jgi:hypothetical protein
VAIVNMCWSYEMPVVCACAAIGKQSRVFGQVQSAMLDRCMYCTFVMYANVNNFGSYDIRM